MIDAHVHFWKLSLGHYGWITPARPVLLRDYLPEDLQTICADTPVTGCIAVQAAPTEAETDLLLNWAKTTPFIRGVIGWADLTHTSCEYHLERWQAFRAFKGVRPMAGVQAGPAWLGDSHDLGLKHLAKRGLILEALALSHHIKGVADIARRHADLQIVLNHAAKPTPKDFDQWRKDIAMLSGHQNVACKLSGLTQQSVDLDDQTRVCDVLLDVLGPNRLIWGSDHPVLMETSTYANWIDTTRTLLAALSVNEQSQITQGTAARIYGTAVSEQS